MITASVCRYGDAFLTYRGYARHSWFIATRKGAARCLRAYIALSPQIHCNLSSLLKNPLSYYSRKTETKFAINLIWPFAEHETISRHFALKSAQLFFFYHDLKILVTSLLCCVVNRTGCDLENSFVSSELLGFCFHFLFVCFCVVPWARLYKLPISSDFERTLMYHIVSYRNYKPRVFSDSCVNI